MMRSMGFEAVSSPCWALATPLGSKTPTKRGSQQPAMRAKAGLWSSEARRFNKEVIRSLRRSCPSDVPRSCSKARPLRCAPLTCQAPRHLETRPFQLALTARRASQTSRRAVFARCTWRMYSQITMEPLTCTFRDRSCPCCGISTHPSSSGSSSASMPSFSAPVSGTSAV